MQRKSFVTFFDHAFYDKDTVADTFVIARIDFQKEDFTKNHMEYKDVCSSRSYKLFCLISYPTFLSLLG